MSILSPQGLPGNHGGGVPWGTPHGTPHGSPDRAGVNQGGGGGTMGGLAPNGFSTRPMDLMTIQKPQRLIGIGGMMPQSLSTARVFMGGSPPWCLDPIVLDQIQLCRSDLH